MVVNQTSFREVNAQINWNKTEETLCLRSKEQLLKIIKMQLRGERKNPLRVNSFFQGSGHGFWFLKAAAASYDAVVMVVSAFPVQTPIFWDLSLGC